VVEAPGEGGGALPLERRAAFGVRAHESVTTRRARVGEVLIRAASS
jgi:hypothetical protein